MKIIVAVAVIAVAPIVSAVEINLLKSDSGTSSINSGANWDSGNPPTSGNDYVVGSKLSVSVYSTSWSGVHKFGGDHLVFRNANGLYWQTRWGDNQWLSADIVVDSGSAVLYPDGFSSWVNLMGTIDVKEGTILKCTASEKPHGYRKIRLRSEISGGGTLQIYLPRFNFWNESNPCVAEEKSCYLEGDNSAFTGRIIAGGCGDLYIVSEDSLGCAPAAFTADWLTLHGTHLCVTNDVTIDDATRGITISDKSSVTVNGDTWSVVYPGGGFDVAEGKTLTLGSVLTATGPVTKYGSGDLVLANTLENITSSIVVTNGMLTVDGVNGGTTASLTLGTGTTLRLASGSSVEFASLTLQRGILSFDLADRTASIPAVTVTDVVNFEGPYVKIAVDGVTTSIAGTPYALLKVKSGSLARHVRECRIFMDDPAKGTLSVVDNGDGSETLWVSPHDPSQVFYLSDTSKSSMSKAVWKLDPDDSEESPVVANGTGVYVAGGKKAFTMPGGTGTGWDDETFGGKLAIIDQGELCNATYGMCNTISNLVMKDGCQLGFSRGTTTDTPSFILDGGLTLLPVGESGTNASLTCCGFGSKRLLDIRSDLVGCGTLILAGEIPPAKEYNTYALSGENTNYVGRVIVYGQTNFYCRISKEENLGGNPYSFVADQLSFNGGGLSVAEDVTIDDANRGIYLKGAGGIARENGNADAYNAKAGYSEADRVYHGGATFNTTAADVTLAVNCPISGTGGVYVRAYGTVALGGVNTHTGANVVQTGTLRIDSATALGTGSLTVWTNGVLSVSLDEDGMPYGLELEVVPSFAEGAKVTVAGFEAKVAEDKGFKVPLFLLPVGKSISTSAIPFESPLPNAWTTRLTSRMVSVNDEERQLIEARFSNCGFVVLFR